MLSGRVSFADIFCSQIPYVVQVALRVEIFKHMPHTVSSISTVIEEMVILLICILASYSPKMKSVTFTSPEKFVHWPLHVI